MLRGIITGLFFGGVLGLMVAAIVSLLSPLPATVSPTTTPQSAAVQPATPGNEGLENPSMTDAPVQADSTAQAPAPAQDVDAAPNADRSSAPKPQPSDVAESQATPAAEGQAAVTVQSDSPVLPSPQARAIEVPGSDSEPSISVDPTQPQSPASPDTGAFTAPQPTPAPVAPAAQDADTPQTDAPSQQPQTAVDTPPAPAEPQPAGSRLKPASDLNTAFAQRKSSRLPSIGGDTATEAGDTTADATEDMQKSLPLIAYAQAVDVDADKPLMSIVLIDDSSTTIDASTIADFPLPISVAVNAQAPDAARRMADYREKGIEVFATINLPTGSAPTDVEVNVAAQLSAVPEAVGIFEGLNGGLQENRAVAEQVIAYTLASGHGLVMQPKGLNTAQKLAAREGVPSITVFRDFDGSGQTEVVIRRFLDQAAFKARQSNGVVMMGRLRPETISALASWALQDRASTVAIAPVSAILQQQ